MESDERVNEQLIFKFDGENSIDISLLVNTLSGISESYKNVVYARIPEASIELKIEAFNKGSFDVIISSIVANIPQIILYTQTSLSNAKLFLDIIKLKKDLKGKKPKNIISQGDKDKIVNQEGETYYYNCEVTNIYMNNPLVDKQLANVFSALRGEKARKAISLKSKDEEVIINEQEYEDMSTNLIEKEGDTYSKHIESQVTTELLLKKPDLLGESKWEFQYDGRIISATIEDKTFLQKVKNGQIKTLYAHVRVPVKMRIEAFLNDKLETINKKYTILTVVGDIIEPESYEQIKLI